MCPQLASKVPQFSSARRLLVRLRISSSHSLQPLPWIEFGRTGSCPSHLSRHTHLCTASCLPLSADRDCPQKCSGAANLDNSLERNSNWAGINGALVSGGRGERWRSAYNLVWRSTYGSGRTRVYVIRIDCGSCDDHLIRDFPEGFLSSFKCLCELISP